MSAILAALALVGLMLSSLGFMAQVSAMTGLPLTRPDVSILGDLLNETALGLALKARIAALLILLLCALLCSRAPRVAAPASTLAGAFPHAPLAWGGPGGPRDGGL